LACENGTKRLNIENVALEVVRVLNENQTPYFLAGSFSSNYWGIPRSTKDADFVILLPPDQLKDLCRKLSVFMWVDDQLRFETIMGTHKILSRHEATGLEVELFFLSNDPHDQARFQRRVKVRVFNHDLFIPTAEDVIVMKLRWARSKDKDDVRDVIAVQGDALDWEYIYSWCDTHGTRALVDEIKESIPPLD
jgi:hypothetical protein